MRNNKNDLIQLIPGNPGTSFVVCLLYALNHKYDLRIPNKDQLSIFTKGIVNSRQVFHSGILNLIAQKYKHNISAFTNNQIIKKLAEEEINKKRVSFSLMKLNFENIKKLLDRFEYVTLSVDIYFFDPYYHDYHFCCLSKNGKNYSVFEPKRGVTKRLGSEGLKQLVFSVEKDLSDAILAFCC